MYFKPVTQRSIDKFLLLLVRGEPDECWPWNDTMLEVDDYGRIFNIKVNRVAYTALVGPIPDGLLVCHTCDHRWCVYPGHLYAGTQAQNRRDMYDRHPTVRASLSAAKMGNENGSSTWYGSKKSSKVRVYRTDES